MVPIVRMVALVGSVFMLVALSIGGLIVAPELRRSIGEAGVRQLLDEANRGAQTENLELLLRQALTPPSSTELLVSKVMQLPTSWSPDGLQALSSLLVASIVVGPADAALRLSTQTAAVMNSLPPLALSRASTDLMPSMQLVLDSLNERAALIREEQIVADEIDSLNGQCRSLRSEVAKGLDLGDQLKDGSPCVVYAEGPLANLPKLKPLRSDPATMEELAQLLRVAGSRVNLDDSRTNKRLADLFSKTRTALASLLPKIQEAAARLDKTRSVQRRHSSTLFIQQQRFVEALFATIQQARILPIHQPIHRLYELLGELAIRLSRR